jgi:Lipocalin-like domain
VPTSPPWRRHNACTADGLAGFSQGENPRGAILYTPDGYMSAQLAGPGPYKDDDRPDAYYVAYSGPYDVDQANQTVSHHVQVSVIPSWLGTTQLRQAALPDQELFDAMVNRYPGWVSRQQFLILGLG